nr:hypothetical protein [Novosphingobium sp. FSW06-99]
MFTLGHQQRALNRAQKRRHTARRQMHLDPVDNDQHAPFTALRRNHMQILIPDHAAFSTLWKKSSALICPSVNLRMRSMKAALGRYSPRSQLHHTCRLVPTARAHASADSLREFRHWRSGCGRAISVMPSM